MGQEKKISLWDIFAVFSKIGAFTIGGGYMMVPAIQEEIIKRGWIAESEMPDIVAVSQSAPGLLTVNMAIFCGYRLRGFKGGLVATLGCILVPFIMILLIAMFFSSFSSNPVVVSIFKGVRPVAVGIVAAYAFKLFSKNAEWWHWAISLLTLGGIVFLRISAVYILLVIIVLSLAVSAYKERRAGK